MSKKAKVINPVLKNMLSPMLYDTAYIVRGSSNLTNLSYSKSNMRNRLYSHVKDEVIGFRICLKKLK
jgi:hypothetical protein